MLILPCGHLEGLPFGFGHYLKEHRRRDPAGQAAPPLYYNRHLPVHLAVFPAYSKGANSVLVGLLKIICTVGGSSKKHFGFGGSSCTFCG
jgi:hypothetical protein